MKLLGFTAELILVRANGVYRTMTILSSADSLLLKAQSSLEYVDYGSLDLLRN